MSLWAIYSWDGPDAARLREEHLAAHLAYAERIAPSIRVGGPLRDGDAFLGSLIILEAADEAEARAALDADPYCQAGVWSRTEIKPFRAVIGTWVGGKTW